MAASVWVRDVKTPAGSKQMTGREETTKYLCVERYSYFLHAHRHFSSQCTGLLCRISRSVARGRCLPDAGHVPWARSVGQSLQGRSWELSGPRETFTRQLRGTTAHEGHYEGTPG